MERTLTTRYSVVKTLFLLTTWVIFGMQLEITGPTLQDMKFRLNTDYESVAWSLSGRSVGMFLGSVIGGVLLDKLGKYIDLMSCLWFVLVSALTFAIPWTLQVTALWCVYAIIGLASAAINTNVEKTLLKLWKEKVTPPMHALHLGYGIGSFIIPLVANPFLGELLTMETSNDSAIATIVGVLNQVNNETVVFESNSDNFQNVSKNSTNDMFQTMVGSEVEYPFIIVSLFGFVISFVFFLYYRMFYRELDITVDTKTNKNTKKKNILNIIHLFNPATCADGDALYGFLTYALVFMFFFACDATQRFYANFIRAYSIDELLFTKDTGSYLNFVFWVCFSIGRFVGIIVGKFLTIRKLVIIESVGLLGSTLVLVIFHHVNAVHTIWVGTVLIGFFTGPLYPTGIVLTDYHVELTGVGIMVINFGAGAGALICIWLTGRLFDIYGPYSFRYMCLGLGCLQVLVCVLQLLLGYKRGSRFKKAGNTSKNGTVGEDDNTDGSGSDDDL